MADEITAYATSIRSRMRLLAEAVEGLDARQLNNRPEFEGANSIWVLTEHILGNARAWILGIACGADLRRDRPAEFASSGDDAAALIAMIERVGAELDAALRALDHARLDMRFVPPQDLWGEGPARETSPRGAIVRVIEHASEHIGHLQVVRALALADG